MNTIHQLFFVIAFSLSGFLVAQCPNNLNSENFGFEDGTLNSFGAFSGTGQAITSNPAEVINGSFSATVQGDDAVTKFYFQSIVAGNEYTGTVLSNELTGGGYAQIQFQWFSDNGTGGVGAQIGATSTGSYVANGTSTITEVAPAGALHGQLIFQAGAGSVIVLDDFCLVDNTASGALEACDGNLLSNGDFEAGTQGWFTFAGTSVDGTNDASTGVGAAIVPVGGEAAANFTAGVVPGNKISFGGSLKSSDADFVIEFRNTTNGTSTFSGTAAVSDPSAFSRVINDLETVPEGTDLIQVWARSNTGQMAVVDDVCVQDLGPDPDFVFPVTLVAFKGEVKGKVNQITWKTATEENVAMFYVERSADGEQGWEEVTTHVAAGNSQTDRNYAVEDIHPYTKTYYRLRSVDFDGSEQFSEIVLVERMGLSGLTAFPNPFKDEISLTTDLGAPAEYQIFDALGRMVMTGIVPAGEQKTLIQTGTLPTGRYLVRVGEQTLSMIK